MKNWTKIALAIVSLTLASTVWADSDVLVLGYNSQTMIGVELNASSYAAVSLYCDGELVINFDVGGPMSSGVGVTWTRNGNWYSLYGCPIGTYTATMSAGWAPPSEFSYDYNTISWSNGYDWAWVDFDQF